LLYAKESKEVEEKMVMDTDNTEDMAILDNSKGGLQESTNLLTQFRTYVGLRRLKNIEKVSNL
jgi:hypothetical protein